MATQMVLCLCVYVRIRCTCAFAKQSRRLPASEPTRIEEEKWEKIEWPKPKTIVFRFVYERHKRHNGNIVEMLPAARYTSRLL